MKKAKELHDKLEEYYKIAIEFKIIDMITAQLMIEIERECFIN